MKPIIYYCFVLLLIAKSQTLLYAQQTNYQYSNIESNYLQISYTQEERAGTLRYMTFHNHNSPGLPHHQHLYYEPFTNTKEVFHHYELSTQYYLNTRTLLRLHLPFVRKQRLSTLNNTLLTEETGLADVSIVGQYHFLNSDLYQENNLSQHLLMAGGGVKFPTGIYDSFDDLGEADPHFESGTGSIDFLFLANYLFTFKNSKTTLGGKYLLTQASKYNYEYGNKLELSLDFAYYKTLKKWQFISNIGLEYSDRKEDYMDAKPTVEDTKGQVLWGNIGWDIAYNSLHLQMSYKNKLFEKLEGIQLSNKQQLHVALQYRFKKQETVKKGRF